jgi:hypothetical protein
MIVITVKPNYRGSSVLYKQGEWVVGWHDNGKTLNSLSLALLFFSFPAILD